MRKISYKVGDTVKHKRFGNGVVSSIELTKNQDDYKVYVDFGDYGERIMYDSFAGLEKVADGSVAESSPISSTGLQIFNNDEFGSVRVVMVDDEPWFVGKDVADVLGYNNTRDALSKRVDDEDKMDGVAIRDSIGRDQVPVLINESGLYSLIFSSKLSSAKRFKHWVTAEVLPSIRKHGLYAIDDIIANPDLGIAALQALKNERERSRALTTQVDIQNRKIAKLQPKAESYDAYMASDGLICLSEAAAVCGMRPKDFKSMLVENGMIKKENDGKPVKNNPPTAKAIKNGYLVYKCTTSSATRFQAMQTKVTTVGVDAFKRMANTWCASNNSARSLGVSMRRRKL